MIQDFFSLSLNSIKKRKLRSWLTLLGIFIGIAAVVALISMGSGLRTAIEGQFGALSPDVLTVSNAETGFGPPGSTAIAKLTDHDVKIIESVNGIKLVNPYLIRISKIEYNEIIKYSYLTGVPSEKEKIEYFIEDLNIDVDKGRQLNEKDRGKIVLGNDYEKAKDDYGKSINIGSKLKINDKDFEVIGILKKSSSFIFNGVILMPVEDLKNTLSIGDEWDAISVQVENKDQVTKVANDIENKLRKDRNQKVGEENFSVKTPVESLAAINSILNIINLIVVGIAAISLLIGGIGIANTMYTSVLERTRDIGTMKAIGAKNSNILTLFVIESGLFGLTGGIAGTIFGLLLAFAASAGANAYFEGNLIAFSISWTLVIGAILFSFFIGIIAGLIPSYVASKLKPVDALRS